MAITRAGTVIRATADGDIITGIVNASSLMYIPGSGTPSVTLRVGNSSGNILWEASGATQFFTETEFRVTEGVYVSLAGTGTVVYIYTE